MTEMATRERELKLRTDLVLPIADEAAVKRALAEPTQEETAESPTHYMWTRVMRFLHHRLAAFHATEGPATSLDLCTGFLLYPELSNTLNLRSCELLSAKLIDETKKDLLAMDMTLQTETGLEIPYITLWQDMFKQQDFSALLQSSFMDVLFRLPLDFDRDKDRDAFATWLKEAVSQRTKVIEHWDPSRHTTEGRWQIDYTETERHITLSEIAANYPVRTLAAIKAIGLLAGRAVSRTAAQLSLTFTYDTPDEELHQQARLTEALGQSYDTDALIDLLCEKLADRAVAHQRMRPFVVYSVDQATPEELLESATQFDAETRSLTLAERACQRVMSDTHLTADVLRDNLGLPEESVTLITCFEGIPFHERMPDPDTEEYAALLEVYKAHYAYLYSLLQPGGHIVIFPWHTKDRTPQSTLFLRQVYESLASLDPHPQRSQNGYSVYQLKEWMNDTDRSVMEWSPLFKDSKGRPLSDDETLDSLVIIKSTQKTLHPHGDGMR